MNTDELMKRECLFCGSPLLGRSDKMFCDDNCRNNYHYQTRRSGTENKSVVKVVNASLLRNREILRTLNNRRSAVVKKQSLVDRHFNFNLMTNIYKTKKGIEYRVIYDYAYKIINDDDVLLFRFSE